MLVNARLVELQRADSHGHGATIGSFNEFLEEIVMQTYRNEDDETSHDSADDVYGKSIPLAAVDFDEISLLYPVPQISALMRRLEKRPESSIPSFLDFNNRSVIVKLLRTKLW